MIIGNFLFNSTNFSEEPNLLLEDDNYKAIQKEIQTKTPLIDWVWLLILLAITLASEWFIRKYNGML